MEEKSNSIWKDAIKPSLILSLISIIISVIIYVFDLVTISLFSGLFIWVIAFVIYVVVLAYLMKAYRNENFGGFIRYGKAFTFGLVITLISSVILSGYYIIFNTVIDPEYEKNITIKMQEKTEEYMISKGLPDEAIEDAMEKSQEKMKKQQERGILIKTGFSFLGSIIILVLTSLIAAAFAKKNKDPYQSAMQDIEE